MMTLTFIIQLFLNGIFWISLLIVGAMFIISTFSVMMLQYEKTIEEWEKNKKVIAIFWGFILMIETTILGFLGALVVSRAF